MKLEIVNKRLFMKKYLLFLFILGLSINCALATGNPSDKYKKNISYPSAPSYSVPSNVAVPTTYTPTEQYSGDSKKAQLDSIAMQMLKAGENHQNLAPYQKKFMDMGVTGICPPQIHQKRTPKCPPIRLEVNGRKMSGSKCAYTCYEYNGKKYDVGYCK